MHVILVPFCRRKIMCLFYFQNVAAINFFFICKIFPGEAILEAHTSFRCALYGSCKEWKLKGYLQKFDRCGSHLLSGEWECLHPSPHPHSCSGRSKQRVGRACAAFSIHFFGSSLYSRVSARSCAYNSH